jgi:two-component system chemotaxis response regulator CheB
MSEIARILIVDDSAYVRKVIRQMLSRSPFLEVVGTARDGREALELAAELQPDVITCDLIMPELDGVGFIKAQMARRPVPIVVVSVASESGELVLAALDAGAVDFVQKPTALATDRVLEIADELIEKVKNAALARPVGNREVPAAATLRPAAARSVDIVVIGISTGGPQALKRVIPHLPAELPVPIAIERPEKQLDGLDRNLLVHFRRAQHQGVEFQELIERDFPVSVLISQRLELVPNR